MEVVLPLIIIWNGWIYSCTPINNLIEMSCVPVREVEKKVSL